MSAKLVEPWFDKRNTAWSVFNILSTEFEIEPKVFTLGEVEQFIRCNGNFRVEMRYVDEPVGEARVVLDEVISLFERLRTELGTEHFDYAILPREQVTLDFTNCKYIHRDVYGEMRRKMDWDDWYGENYSALWDILTGLSYKGDDFTILRPRMYRDIPYGDNVIFTETVDNICAVFLRAQQTYGDITVDIRYVDDAEGMEGYLL